MNNKEKVRAFIEENLIKYDDETSFSDEDNIFSMGFVNSLFAMKLLNYIESEFNIIVEGDEMELSNFSSVNRIDSFLNRKAGASNIS